MLDYNPLTIIRLLPGTRRMASFACICLSYAYISITIRVYKQLPSVKVVIVRGEEDITIRVSDEGGGIPRSQVVKTSSKDTSSKGRRGYHNTRIR